MIQVEATLNVADNTGAKTLKVLSIPGYSKKKYAYCGDIVSAVVRGVTSSAAQVQDGQVVQAMIVRTKKERRRPDGIYVRFDDNAAVVVDKKGTPIGARVLGPIAREVKDRGFSKIASLAKEVW